MKQLTAIIIPALLTAHTLHAREKEAWSYSQCVEYAREHNIDLRKFLREEKSAELSLEEAKAQWTPTLDFATGHAYANTPWGAGQGASPNAYNSSYSLSAGWTLYDGGVRTNTIKRGSLGAEQRRLETAQAMRTLETDILQVYINLLYNREAIGIYEEAEALSRAQAERGKALMESGRISRVDYSRLVSQHEQDLYESVNARASYSTRLMELKQILELGIDAGIEPDSVSWTDAEVLSALPDISDSYSLALDNDLVLKSYGLEREIAGLDTEIARAGAMPKISVNASAGTGYMAPASTSFGTALRRNLSETIGLTLSVPILDQKKTKTATAQARVREMDADLDTEKRRTQLSQLVEGSYIDTRAAQARFEASLRQLESAQLTSDLTNEQFSLGYVDAIELMSAHNDLTEARRSALQAKYMAMLGKKMIEYWRTATITL